MKILKLMSFVVLLAGSLTFSGCVTEEVDDPYGYNYNTNKTSSTYDDSDDENKPPNSLVTAQVYDTADTLILNNGKILKLAGIATPRPGEAYYEKSREFVQYMIGLKFLRLTWVKGTKRADKVWNVNVIFEHRNLVGSLNEQLVKNGLAKVTIAEPLQFESANSSAQNLDNEEKIFTLSDSNNRILFDRLKNFEKEAINNKLNIWSGRYEK